MIESAAQNHAAVVVLVGRRGAAIRLAAAAGPAAASRRAAICASTASFQASRSQLPDAEARQQGDADQRRRPARQKWRRRQLIFPAGPGGLVVVLQRDQQALERPQQAEADDDGQRQEDHQMEPEGRLIGQFDPEREAEHEEAGEQHHENRRAVARDRRSCSRGRNWSQAGASVQKAVEQLALAAARASAGGWRREWGSGSR